MKVYSKLNALRWLRDLLNGDRELAEIWSIIDRMSHAFALAPVSLTTPRLR